MLNYLCVRPIRKGLFDVRRRVEETERMYLQKYTADGPLDESAVACIGCRRERQEGICV
jgi:hypothetical protein